MNKLEVYLSDTWEDGGKVRDYGSVLVVKHNGELITEQVDTMETEDVAFLRDLCWVPDIIERVYALGFTDGQLDTKV